MSTMQVNFGGQGQEATFQFLDITKDVKRSQTFPVPGGPKRRIPFHGERRPVKYLKEVERKDAQVI